ncbi:MAG: helix-turn-helix domain-containing protein [Nitrososphaeraceae archaeon]|nr:helix-turn-helix domain-containing protein [Nitrososphaeraceae archaeon]
MKKTNKKKEYCRAQAILSKCEGRTHKAIATEQEVDERTIQRWIAEYIKKGIEGPKIHKSSSGSKPRITDKDREIILSALFNDPTYLVLSEIHGV